MWYNNLKAENNTRGRVCLRVGKGVVMKINWNRKYSTVAVYSLLVIAVSVLFIVFVFKFDGFLKTFSWVGRIAAPIICGIAIAYVLNPLMTWIENKLFRNFKQTRPKEQNIVVRKLQQSSVGDKAVVKTLEKHSATVAKKVRRRKIISRAVSILLTFVIFFAIIAGIVIAIVPSVATSIISLADNIDVYVYKIEEWTNNAFEKQPEIMNMIFEGVTSLKDIISNIAEQIRPHAGDIIGNVSGFLGSLLSGIKNFLLGLFIAIYLLFSKERLMAQLKKISCALLKPAHAENFLGGCAKSNNIFKKYIISNILDSLIILVFMIIGMFAMRMPYQMLISVVCAVTNLVPFFGPFLGAIPCGILILLVDPAKVIWFAIFVLVIQQLDGNVIKPLLFGETMGLPAIWVLVSIIVGGAMFNIPGMLLGAPVFAVFYMLFAEFIKNRLVKKNLPGETDSYEADAETLSEVYLQYAAEPGKLPISFEDATKHEVPKPGAPDPNELPEPISENGRSRRKRKKDK